MDEVTHLVAVGAIHRLTAQEPIDDARTLLRSRDSGDIAAF
jgi:hypothetical protein